MRKVQFLAVFWTLIIAIPFTAIALAGAAYITDNLTEISNAIALVSQNTLNLGRDLLLEAEIAGLIAGQVIIFALLALTWYISRKDINLNNSQ